MIYRIIYKKFDYSDLMFHTKIIFETKSKSEVTKKLKKFRKLLNIDNIETYIYVEKFYPTTVY